MKRFFLCKKPYIIIFVYNFKTKKTNLLYTYFGIIGNIFKQPYFSSFTNVIISNNYQCNIEVLVDIFVKEFYLSFHHLVDPNDEILQSFFISSFGKLPGDSLKKVQTLALGNKLYIFENYIKEITSKRNNVPAKACDFAGDLKNEATFFYNWYFQIYDFWSLESKSISDKIGNEILECAIAYYNASTPKTIEHAKLALKVLTWASDFAFNQALRDRINESISILMKAYPNTGYNIVDFGLKDRTRTTRRITPKDKSADPKTNNLSPPKTNNVQSSKASTSTSKNSETKEFKKLNQRKSIILKSILKNVGVLFLILLPFILMVYLIYAPRFQQKFVFK